MAGFLLLGDQMDNKNVEFTRAPFCRFGLTLNVKDKEGNPTGETKSIDTNDSGELWEFWTKYQGKPKRRRTTNKRKRRRKGKKERIPGAKEADKIMNELYTNREDESNNVQST